jgi:hypothetical protein
MEIRARQMSTTTRTGTSLMMKRLFLNEKLGTIHRGGEDSSAYVFLYRSKGGAGNIFISPPTPEQGTPNGGKSFLMRIYRPQLVKCLWIWWRASISCLLLLTIGNHPLTSMTSSVYGWRTCARLVGYGDAIVVVIYILMK